MAFLEDLTPEDVKETLARLADGNLPVSLTVRYQSRWVTFETRVIAEKAGVFWVELPKTDHLPTPYEFQPSEQVGMTFSLGHRKYVYSAMVIGKESYRLDPEAQNPRMALRLDAGDRMQRVERRLHERLNLAGQAANRASFWLGGSGARAADGEIDGPVWSGRVLNLSTGGLLVRASFEAVKYVEVGDILGVHVHFGTGKADATLDGQVRHCDRDGEMALIGIQFIELAEALDGNRAIQAIKACITEEPAGRETA